MCSSWRNLSRWMKLTNNFNRVRTDLYVRLRTRIAAAYLALGHNRMARICVERAYRNVLNTDAEYGSTWHPKVQFSIDSEMDASSASYAGAAAVVARISTEHGDLYEALSMLEEACRLNPKRRVYQRAHDWTREELQKAVEKREKRWQTHRSRFRARIMCMYLESVSTVMDRSSLLDNGR